MTQPRPPILDYATPRRPPRDKPVPQALVTSFILIAVVQLPFLMGILCAGLTIRFHLPWPAPPPLFPSMSLHTAEAIQKGLNFIVSAPPTIVSLPLLFSARRRIKLERAVYGGWGECHVGIAFAIAWILILLMNAE